MTQFLKLEILKGGGTASSCCSCPCRILMVCSNHAKSDRNAKMKESEFPIHGKVMKESPIHGKVMKESSIHGNVRKIRLLHATCSVIYNGYRERCFEHQQPPLYT